MWRLHGTSLPVLGTKAGKGQSKKYVADDHEYVSEHCTAVAVPCFSPFSGFLILVGWEPLSRPGVTLSNLACPDLCHQPACWAVLLSPNPPFPWLCLQLLSCRWACVCLLKCSFSPCYGLTALPTPYLPQSILKLQFPVPIDVTLLGSKVGQVKMKSLGWGLIQHDWHPYKGKFGCRHVQSKDSKRPSSKSRSAWGHQQLGERPGTSLMVVKKNQPCWHLNLGLPACRNEREGISVVCAIQFVVLSYSSPRKWMCTIFMNIFFQQTIHYFKLFIIWLLYLTHYILFNSVCASK